MSPDLFSGLCRLDDSLRMFALFWLFCAVVTAFLAANRGQNSFKWFALGLLIGPLAFVLVVRPSNAQKGDRHETSRPEK